MECDIWLRGKLSGLEDDDDIDACVNIKFTSTTFNLVKFNSFLVSGELFIREKSSVSFTGWQDEATLE